MARRICRRGLRFGDPRHRSSPTHAFGIFLALVSFPISIFVRAVLARPPSSRCRHRPRHDVINILSITLSYLYAGATPPANSPDTCALFVPTLAVLLQLRSLPAFLPCVHPPPHTSASARTPPR